MSNFLKILILSVYIIFLGYILDFGKHDSHSLSTCSGFVSCFCFVFDTSQMVYCWESGRDRSVLQRKPCCGSWVLFSVYSLSGLLFFQLLALARFSLFLVFYSFVCCCHKLNSRPVYTTYMLCKLSRVPNTKGFSPGYSFLNLNFDSGCISCSSHCCDRMPNKSMLRKEGFVLRNWVQFTAEWDSWVSLCHGEEALRSECSYLVYFLFLFCLGPPTMGWCCLY